MGPILILYYSRHGATAALARAIALGVESTGATAMLRTVPELVTVEEDGEPSTDPASGPPYVSLQDLKTWKVTAFQNINMLLVLKHVHFWIPDSAKF